MCLCARSACRAPLLAGVCGVGVCPCSRVLAAHRNSWLGCWVVCVFRCALLLYPATPGWGVRVCVCLCARRSCIPPLLAGLCGVGVCALTLVLAAPRHSWPGCWGLYVFVFAPGLYPATPGWDVRFWVCSTRVLAAPRHSWRGCSGVCVFVCALRLSSTTPCWGVRCGCVCLGSGSGCAPPLLGGVFGCVSVCVRAPPVPRHSSLGCWGVCVFVCALLL